MNFRITLILIFLVSLFSCKKTEIDDINNLNGDFIYVIGHGGVGFQTLNTQLPENSMLSIIRAINVYGADGVEVDVQLSKDLNLILFHDNELELSTNGTGYVYEYNKEQVTQFKYNRDIFANLFIDEYIITLESVLQKISQQKNTPQLHLDLRSSLYDNSIYSDLDFISIYTDKIVKLIKKYDYVDNTYIASGNTDVLKKIDSIEPTLKLMIETNDIYNAVETVNNEGWYGILSANSDVTTEDVEYVHSNSIRMALFNIRVQADIISAINKNPDFILTDNIPQTQQALYH